MSLDAQAALFVMLGQSAERTIASIEEIVPGVFTVTIVAV